MSWNTFDIVGYTAGMAVRMQHIMRLLIRTISLLAIFVAAILCWLVTTRNFAVPVPESIFASRMSHFGWGLLAANYFWAYALEVLGFWVSASITVLVAQPGVVGFLPEYSLATKRIALSGLFVILLLGAANLLPQRFDSFAEIRNWMRLILGGLVIAVLTYAVLKASMAVWNHGSYSKLWNIWKPTVGRILTGFALLSLYVWEIQPLDLKFNRLRLSTVPLLTPTLTFIIGGIVVRLAEILPRKVTAVCSVSVALLCVWFWNCAGIADITIDHPSQCPVHHVAMEKRVVRPEWGLRFDLTGADKTFHEAKSKFFPMDGLSWPGGCVVQPYRRIRIFSCPVCRAERGKWLNAHPAIDAS